MTTPAHTAGLPLGFTDGAVELLKWIALASMFIDHFGRHLMGHPQDGWVFAAGRIAFPLFALVLALNLAREGDRTARARRTATRLALWCAIAVLPSVWARGDPAVVNVLGTLALGTLACWTVNSPAPVAARLAVLVAAVMLATQVEFGSAGALLVAAVYLLATGRHGAGGLASAAALLATAWLNSSFGGMAAFAGTLVGPALAVLVRPLPLRLPRLRWWFYAIYPVHLAAIGALNHWGASAEAEAEAGRRSGAEFHASSPARAKSVDLDSDACSASSALRRSKTSLAKTTASDPAGKCSGGWDIPASRTSSRPSFAGSPGWRWL